MRVTQQKDCYAAQEALGYGREFADIAEAQRFVDGLRDTAWWQLQGYSLHVLRIEVHELRTGTHRGNALWVPRDNCGVVSLKPSGLNERVICHEVAHVLADAIHDSTGHDPAWACLYLTLVSCVMGPEAYVTLRDSFDEHGVDYDVTTRAASSRFAL